MLDEQLPRQLAPYLTSHAVRIVQQQGLSALGDTSEGLHGATDRYRSAVGRWLRDAMPSLRRYEPLQFLEPVPHDDHLGSRRLGRSLNVTDRDESLPIRGHVIASERYRESGDTLQRTRDSSLEGWCRRDV